MEHHVVIEKLCSCAKRAGISQIETFESKENALSSAQQRLDMMLSTFCGKHDFDIVEVDDHYVIGMLGGCDCSKSGA
jgi:hypothetical protein